MPTTTANGLTATAVRGVPNTWIVRVSRLTYWAIETDGTDISAIDTDNIAPDTRWSIPGEIGRTFVRDYDTAEEGRDLAGWHIMFDQNHSEPYRTANAALSQLKLQMRVDHAERQARIAEAKRQAPESAPKKETQAMNIVLTRESNGKTDRVEITAPNCGWDLSWTFSTDGVVTKEDRYEGPDAHGAGRRWADHLCQTQGYTEQQES